MKILSDVHVHTKFCDGRNTPEEMADRALELGFTGLGFSAHSPAGFDKTCPGIFGMEEKYRAEILRLKQQYSGKLEILCGVEQDYDAPVKRENYDYIIGSVHYLPDAEDRLVAVDGTLAHMKHILKDIFKSNAPDFYRAFYQKSAENVRKYRPDVIGHFDLIIKHNANNTLFDEQDGRYKKAALAAVDSAAEEAKAYGGVFEINTGGVARGYRQAPYPDGFLLKRLAKHDARIMLTSDSHAASNLGFGFDDALQRVVAAGFKTIWMIKNGGFEEVEIKM